jgi:hypothetical protein
VKISSQSPFLPNEDVGPLGVRGLRGLVLVVFGTGVLLGISGLVILSPLRAEANRPWEALPSTQQSLAQTLFELDPLCSGAFVREVVFTAFTADRVAWKCSMVPWGNHEHQFDCFEGRWTGPGYKRVGWPEFWAEEGNVYGPEC